MRLRANRLPLLTAGAAIALVCALATTARAADPENCLLCHRFPGFGRIDDDGKTVRLYHVDPAYYDQGLGPHARLRCTDCHPREEVQVIPHQPVSPVDCTRACHLVSPDRAPIRFAHQGIAEMLEDSAHNAAVLEKANQLLGGPQRPGQARCLLCHDEPVFRLPELAHHQPALANQRCDVCHTEELPQDTQFALRHVAARVQPARTHEELARSCALCHSHPDVREQFGRTDTVASYLASFHGKAMLLGSEETASCLDCHVGELQNVHMIRSHRDPEASTHANKLPDTCRSPACHPGAGVLLTSAAVHLELTPSLSPSARDRTAARAADGSVETTDAGWWRAEYLIALMFVVVILFTFGPSALLQMMELLQTVLGRTDPKHHENVRLNQKILAAAGGRKALTRFTVHQRIQHWLLFVCFTLLVLTGFPIKFADRDWAGWTITLFGGLDSARQIHRWAGLVLILGAVYHVVYVLVYLVRKRRAENKTLLATVLELPLVVNAADVRELLHLLGFLFFFRKTRPAAGRFGLKEKFEYFGVFWGCTLLGVTGVLMWANAWTSRYVPGRVLTIASLIHTLEAFLALLHVGVFHMIGVIFSPHVFPVSKAMFTGETPASEMADAHAGMLADAANKLDVSTGQGATP